MKVTVELKVTGVHPAKLARAVVITRQDMAEIGQAFADTIRERTDTGLDVRGKAIPINRLGRYVNITGRLRRSIKARYLSDTGATVGAAVPYARKVAARGIDLFGASDEEAREIAEAMGAAVERNLEKSTA